MTVMVSNIGCLSWALQQVLGGVCTLVARTNPAYTSTAPLARFKSYANQRSVYLRGMLDEWGASATQGRQASQQRP
jgi:hypothetical protein